MKDPHSAGRDVTAPALEVTQNQLVKSEESTAVGRRVKAAHIAPQKGLGVRIKSFLPAFIYKYIVKLMSSSQSDQKALGIAIADAGKENADTWNQLGQLKAKSSPRELKILQLACESTQFKLDQLEGRSDSPVTAQRATVIELLNKAMLMRDEEIEAFEYQYIEAVEKLKEIQQHEIVLESELHAAKIKLKKKRPDLDVQINSAEEIKTRKSCSVLFPTDEQVATDAQTLIQGEKAKEELKMLQQVVTALKKEFFQFQKILIDEEASREAYLRYGDRVDNKMKGDQS